MKQTTQTPTQVNAVALLIKFVNQRPWLEFADYGDIKYYRQDSREITKDRADFYEFMAMADIFVDNLNVKLIEQLTKYADRLTLENGKLKYITGQYFPTEYRPAGCRVIKAIVWNALREEKNAKGEYIRQSGDDIRKVFKRYLSRRTYKNYFN